MDITPRDVNYFLAVVEHGRLAKAAEACHVTQPALTKAIQRLEAECGLILFERDARGMRLTAEGERFKEVAQLLGRRYENAIQVAANVRAQQSGLLRLGSTDATRASIVPSTLSALLRQRPGLRATLQIRRSDQLALAVVQGQLDVAVIPTYGAAPEGCDHVKIGQDPHLPVMSARHPLAGRSRLAPADLMPYRWINGAHDSAGFQNLGALFARHQLPAPIVAVEVEYASESVLSLVRNSDMLAMIPRSFFRATDQLDFRVVPIPDFHIDRSVLCITRAGMERSPLTAAFCDLLLQQAQAAPGGGSDPL
ncbi:LysR family transcriptional regulator [Variovorax sp. 770b2]|uniref:LysR family transcriptional regulator n=1 Tax=Variovorax sp. 770b2 TaxID=1566271 RepID=UPI0008E8CA91|nr:LysR family transcriptional regulator [Variovorax sp. 770b2]SFQ37144.1 DNA-binding transcriptional regulator, LysR family [Variovorax sp. 770b2]